MDLVNKIRQEWDKSDYGQALVQWYARLSIRGQVIVQIGFVLVTLFILYLSIFKPSMAYLSEAKNNLAQERSNLIWMKQHSETARMLSKELSRTNKPAVDGDQSLLSIVNSTSKSMNITSTGFEMDSNGRVRLSLEGISFSKLIEWLFVLRKNHNVSVSRITVTKQADSGQVNVQLLLKS